MNKEKECRDCFHAYCCQMPQEGYNYNPDTCQYNPDNKNGSIRGREEWEF